MKPIDQASEETPMIGQRDNRPYFPVGDQGRRTTPSSRDGVAPGSGSAPPAALIRVQCPNPACGKLQTAMTSWAGQVVMCPSCQGRIVIPAIAAPPPAEVQRPEPPGQKALPEAAAASAVQPRPHTPQDPGAPATVRAGCIGRGNAGKTALFRTMDETIIGDTFPSGLTADCGDPREVARMIREAEQTRRLLHLSGLPPTLHATPMLYYLYEGDERRVAYEAHEVIGQILTHTFPDSAPEQQALYGEYLQSLATTDVLWAVVPCPPANPGARERRRYADDLRITLAYLREALRWRPTGRPVAVALVLSKIDTIFDNEEEARATLTDAVLRRALGPLVQMLETSGRVSEAAIIPVTSFGFGNAVRRDAAASPAEVNDVADESSEAEPVWVLREGVDQNPCNLSNLFLWTLITGLLNEEKPEVSGGEDPTDNVIRMLRADLQAGDPWFVPLRG
jgi:hypothetical protein